MSRLPEPKSFVFVVLASLLVIMQAESASAGRTAPMQRDNDGRPAARVTINGGAKFLFAVDTAAQMTALGPHVVDRLQLSPVPGQKAQVHGSGGVAMVDMYALESLAFAGIRKTNLVLPMPVRRQHNMGHDGILGADIFGNDRIEFDFENHVIRTGAQETGNPLKAVPANFLLKIFAVIDVRIDGVKAAAIIDTGARESFGSPALMAALQLSAGDPGLSRVSERMGVTGHEIERITGFSGTLKIGDRTFDKTPLVFMAAPVFQSIGLPEGPALVLGMDVLGQLAGFAIDYRHAKFEYR